MGQAASIDSDGDGLSDTLEQRLLEQFAPSFEIAAHDCSDRPAAFTPNVKLASVQAEDGTIYGQAFPVRAEESAQQVELHFYHLWRTDCGEHGHPLDAEHVAVLVRASGDEWKARYWYAAAHEQTVCDVSQIARASTLQAENKGARVWISPGKHASYLDPRLCRAGCGADACEQMVPGSPLLASLASASPDMTGVPWLSMWTSHDEVVLPPDSARFTGARNVELQTICADDAAGHTTLPADPLAIGLTVQTLGTSPLPLPTPAASQCAALRALAG